MPSSQAFLSGMALAGIIVLSILLLFVKAPAENHDFLVASFASLSTALTIGGGRKIADMLTSNSGPGTTVQSDAQP